MKKNQSVIWKKNDEELQELLDNSDSISSVLLKLGLASGTGNHRTLNRRIKDSNLSVERLNENRKKKNISIGIKMQIPLDEIMVENSTYNRGHLKNRIIKLNLIPHKCSECSLESLWNNKPIVLQLDHINGINNDNRLENLRFLCPNCHSQTSTFSGKHNRKSNTCCDCKTDIKKQSKRCGPCDSKHRSKLSMKTKPSYEQLLLDLESLPYTKVGAKYGVSDNAIRKWIKIYEKEIKENN